MGIVHSNIRLLGDKILNYHRLIRKSVAELLQKVRFIFCFLRPRKAADHPILPIQHPNSTDALPLQTILTSLPGNDEESQCHDDSKVYAVSDPHEQWPPATNSATGEIISSIPYSVEETDPKNGVPFVGERQEERWIKHYSSHHRILVVGDGDFSFSACLAVAFRNASNMTATSLNTLDFLNENYGNAASNIEELRSRGCKVMHGVDATSMANHASIGHLKFDRIIFNFPFAGFFKNLSRESQLRRHRRLVSLFLKNAKQMMSENGEIHISHKTNGFHIEWNPESIASSHMLRLIEAVRFHHRDYPGYRTKCGFGGDNIFNCNPSQTYKFGLIII